MSNERGRKRRTQSFDTTATPPQQGPPNKTGFAVEKKPQRPLDGPPSQPVKTGFSAEVGKKK